MKRMKEAAARAAFVAELAEELAKQMSARGVDVAPDVVSESVAAATTDWDVDHNTDLLQDAFGRVQDRRNIRVNPGPAEALIDLTCFEVRTSLRQV